MTKPLTFVACAGDVFWRTETAGGSVYCSPEMICDLRQMLFEASADGAQAGDINLVRSATRMSQQLNDAQRRADDWRAAARASLRMTA